MYIDSCVQWSRDLLLPSRRRYPGGRRLPITNPRGRSGRESNAFWTDSESNHFRLIRCIFTLERCTLTHGEKEQSTRESDTGPAAGIAERADLGTGRVKSSNWPPREDAGSLQALQK